jgi:hypothetical protein
LEHVAEREGLEATAEDAADEDVRFHLTMERVFAWLRERSEITTV